MENDNSGAAALLNWLCTNEEAADLRPDARVNIAHRMMTTLGPHSTPEQRAEFLQAPRKKEPHLFQNRPFSPEVRAEKLKNMTAAELLAEGNLRGGAK